MKLYVVVDKKSEVIATETVGLVSITLYGLKETAVRRRRESDMMETSDIVAVELKEVAGPCEWCEPKTIPLFYAECVRANIDDESQLMSVNYCPNCGRKIKEQTGGTERKEREMEK